MQIDFFGDMLFHLEISKQVCKSGPNVALILGPLVGMLFSDSPDVSLAPCQRVDSRGNHGICLVSYFFGALMVPVLCAKVEARGSIFSLPEVVRTVFSFVLWTVGIKADMYFWQLA